MAGACGCRVYSPWTNSRQDTLLPWISGSMLDPVTVSGTSTPTASRIVGMTSCRHTGAATWSATASRICAGSLTIMGMCVAPS